MIHSRLGSLESPQGLQQTLLFPFIWAIYIEYSLKLQSKVIYSFGFRATCGYSLGLFLDLCLAITPENSNCLGCQGLKSD